MTKSRPTYSIQFQKDVAHLVLEKAYSLTEACNAVGASRTAISRRGAQLKEEQEGVTPKSPVFTEQQKEIKRIEWMLSKYSSSYIEAEKTHLIIFILIIIERIWL